MDRTAQERTFLNKLREKVNLSGKILEGISPEFGKTMTRLRHADEKIRSYAEQLKSLVRQAKSDVRRRDYLSAAAAMSAFHERCRYIAAELERFRNSIDMKHYKMLLDQFDDEQKEQLFGYNPTKDIQLEEVSEADDGIVVASLQLACLEKQAGLSDWWFKITDPLADVVHNLTDQRAIAMKALEKRFSVSFLKDLKKNSITIVHNSEKFLHFLMGTFKKLATALATRNLNNYTEEAKKFVSKFTEYHKTFSAYYERNIVPLKQQHEKLVEEQKKLHETVTEQKRQQELASQHQFQQTLEQQARPLTQQIQQQVSTGPLPEPTQTQPMEQVEQEKLMYQPENLQELKEENLPIDLSKQKEANEEFLDRLEIFANEEDPQLMIEEVLNHSAMLEETDPEASLKLLAIAEGMIADKTAGVRELDETDFLADEGDSSEKKSPLISPIKPPPLRQHKQIAYEIPEGRVDKIFSSFPTLKVITPDQIKATPGTINHIASIIGGRLYDLNMEPDVVPDNFELKIIEEVKKAVVRGIVLFNHPSDDAHNPLDRQLEVYSYIDLSKIDPSILGVAKLRILCRLSLKTGLLSLRTVQRQFKVE